MKKKEISAHLDQVGEALDAPELDAISIMETAVSELEKWRTNA